MTPSLQQAIKLLQMTRMELQGILTQELVENPLLEEVDEDLEAESTEDEEEEAEAKTAEDSTAEELDHSESMEDIDLDAYFNDYLDSTTGPSVFELKEAPPLENTLSRDPDLYDHLLWQLHMSEVGARQREIAELVIGNLDPEGFLVATSEEIQRMGGDAHGEEPYSIEEVEEAIQLVQGFDPPGIACRTLQESLVRQLVALGEPEASLARRILTEAWEPFLKRQFQALARQSAYSFQRCPLCASIHFSGQSGWAR